MKRDRIVVLAKGRAVDVPLYRSWTETLDLPVTLVSELDINWVPPPDTGLIVTAQQYEEPEALLLRQAMQDDIPVLIIADGVLEFRNTWMNPDIVPGSLFQPVAGHKIAVLGNAQARVLESWGNIGKCEVVGSPRFDSLLAPTQTMCEERESFRILVTTARRPGFTDDQLKAVRQSLVDLKQWLDEHPALGYHPVKIIWRLTAGLEDDLGIDAPPHDTCGTSLAELLPNVDALITTPSTTMIEGMLAGKPVAVLDYTNSPVYTPPAWSITARDHIDGVVPELLQPPEAKLQFQRMTLDDALACTSPATPRMHQLIREMLRIGNECRDAGGPITFPPRILDSSNHAFQPPCGDLDLETLFPGRVTNAAKEGTDLQVENAHLLRLAKQQQRYIRELHIHVSEIDSELRKSSPMFAKWLRIFRHPKCPTLESLGEGGEA